MSDYYRVIYTLNDKSADTIMQVTYFDSIENTAAGEDGIFASGDDKVNYYWVAHCVENTNCERYENWAFYETAGNDDVWFTDDDRKDLYNKYTYEGDQQIEQVIDKGEDGLFLTSDDEQNNNYRITITSNNKREVRKYSVGDDGVSLTDDDVLSGYFVQVDEEYELRTQLTYDDPGLDGEWFTGDDLLYIQPIEADNGVFFPSYFITKENGAEENTAIDRLLKWTPGPDRLQFTEDDEIIESYEISTIKVNDGFVLGSDLTRIVRSESGPDGVWDSADDHVDSRCFITVSGTKTTEETKKTTCYSDVGSDSVDFSGDESVSFYSIQTYEEDDNRSKRWTTIDYSGPGADGIWFTDDDESPLTTIQIFDVH